MFSAIPTFSPQRSSETHRNQSTKPAGQTSEIAIAVEDLSAELQREFQHIEQPQTRSAPNTLLKKATPALTLLCDASASTLSYSAALLVNANTADRTIASGVAWTAAGLFSGVEHTLLASKKMLVAVLADASCFSAGIGSMASALLSKYGQTQTLVNSAAYISNALWIASGTLSNISVLHGEYNQAIQPSNLSLERTAKILTQLAGVADILAGLTGLISTAKTNGSSAQLNQLSSNFWMTGSLLNTFAAVLQTQIRSLERTSTLSTISKYEEQLQDQIKLIDSQLAQIAEQTATINQQSADLKVYKHVTQIQDGAIAKLRQENLYKRAHITPAQDDSHCVLPNSPQTIRHQRSFSETTDVTQPFEP